MKKKFILVFSIIIIAIACFTLYKYTNQTKIKNIYNSLVYIESISNDSITNGSGFVYKTDESKNYIVTNYHVIEGSYNIYVYNINKKKVKATLVNYDEYNDIAVLIVDDKLNLKPANIGNSSSIKKDDSIFVVGTPINIKNFGTVSKGNIIEIKKLNSLDLDFNVIKVSAKTDFGNSGGPLLDSNGKVIGMMFLMDKTNNNMSYAIPIDFVIDRAKDLEKRVSLGATMTNTTNTELLNQYNIQNIQVKGVIILEVKNNSVLDKYSFIKGDIITSINDSKISNVEELREQLYKYKQGDIIEIGYYRDNAYYKVSVQL